MISREKLIHDRPLYESRAKGALIGLAVGDAMGDLGRSQEQRARYGVVTNLAPEASSTDDTEFGVLTARCLLDNRGALTPEAVGRAWRTYILERGGAKKRAGRPLYGAIENLRRGMMPPLSGRHNVMNTDDGAAMRVSPLGIFRAADPEGAAALAEVDASVSHSADGIWAARAVAASVAVAAASATTSAGTEEIVRAARAQLPKGSWIAAAMDTAMEICERKGCIEEAYEELHTRLWTPEHATAAEAIPQAFAILRLTGGDFRKGLLWSANFGRDADTICGVVCSLIGAMHGVEVFPSEWVQQVRRPSGVCLEFTKDEDMLDLAVQLVALACGGNGE